MSKKDEALKLALEALEPLVKRAAPWGELDWLNGCKAITALREALAEPQEKYIYGTPLMDAMTGKANEALDKKAENARELGLDYEPRRWAVFCQGCRKEWTVSYPHPGKSICADCDDKLAEEQPAQHDPSAGTQVSKVWRDGEKLMAKQIPLEDFYKPAQQEPVSFLDWYDNAHWGNEDFKAGCRRAWNAALAQRTWVGLTDEERKDIELGIEVFGTSVEDVLKEAEAKLREKNNG